MSKGRLFEEDTFTILNMPAPFAGAVRAIQGRFQDESLASIPVHITITGSGGAGAFDSSQDERETWDILERVAANTPTIKSSFAKVLRFPDTDVFALTVSDERPFIHLHEQLVTSGIRFKPSPFPFKPHCTLHVAPTLSATESEELLQVRVPGKFVLRSLSVYVARPTGGFCIREFNLRGREG